MKEDQPVGGDPRNMIRDRESCQLRSLGKALSEVRTAPGKDAMNDATGDVSKKPSLSSLSSQRGWAARVNKSEWPLRLANHLRVQFEQVSNDLLLIAVEVNAVGRFDSSIKGFVCRQQVGGHLVWVVELRERGIRMAPANI